MLSSNAIRGYRPQFRKEFALRLRMSELQPGRLEMA